MIVQVTFLHKTHFYLITPRFSYLSVALLIFLFFSSSDESSG